MDAGRRVLEERGRRDPLIHGSQHEQETKEEPCKISLQSLGKPGSPGSQEIWRREEEEQLAAIKANECGGGPIWDPMKSRKDRKVPRTEK